MGGSRLRALLLVLLVVQTSATVLLLRYSRSQVLFDLNPTSTFPVQVIWSGPALHFDNDGFLHRSREVPPQLGLVGDADGADGDGGGVHQPGGEEAQGDDAAGNPCLPLCPAEQPADIGSHQP